MTINFSVSKHKLINEYFVAVRARPGQRIGIGIHYDPDLRQDPEFEPYAMQPVLIFITVDVVIVTARLVLQPPGGWYPSVVLTSSGIWGMVDW